MGCVISIRMLHYMQVCVLDLFLIAILPLFTKPHVRIYIETFCYRAKYETNRKAK